MRRSAPKITITCDCGVQRKLAYGESYVCECGRAWSTKQIPEADYAAIQALDRRYRRMGWIGFGGFLVLCLGVVLLGNPVTLLLLVPAGLMLWFSILRPMVRRRHWRAIQALTRRWTLRAE